eukprot:2248911-Rhodomonas_salina.1
MDRAARSQPSGHQSEKLGFGFILREPGSESPASESENMKSRGLDRTQRRANHTVDPRTVPGIRILLRLSCPSADRCRWVGLGLHSREQRSLSSDAERPQGCLSCDRQTHTCTPRRARTHNAYTQP